MVHRVIGVLETIRMKLVESHLQHTGLYPAICFKYVEGMRVCMWMCVRGCVCVRSCSEAWWPVELRCPVRKRVSGEDSPPPNPSPSRPLVFPPNQCQLEEDLEDTLLAAGPHAMRSDQFHVPSYCVCVIANLHFQTCSTFPFLSAEPSADWMCLATADGCGLRACIVRLAGSERTDVSGVLACMTAGYLYNSLKLV